MSTDKPMTVRIERAGKPEVRLESVSVDEVARLITALSGERGTTISVQPDGLDERLLVAVDGTRAFIGLKSPDGLFQFAPRDTTSTATLFTIGGQVADIDSRVLVDLDTAARVLREWVIAGARPSLGTWARQ